MYLNKCSGFIDLQINGFLGVDFSDVSLTKQGLLSVASHLAKRGTSAFCPTVVTGPESMYSHNLSLIADAISDPDFEGRILGIHLEGPFISPKPGARGVHAAEHIRKPSIDTFKKYYDLAQGKISILTIAPEEPGAIDLIEYAVSLGVIVSIGHHLADDKHIDDAISAGAILCTHVGNGLPNTIDRHKNPLWKELSDDRLSCMFITDGHHLPAPLIKTALRAKGIDDFIVTSDAAAIAGMPPGIYNSFGTDVIVEESGRISCPGTGSLAGSHSDMFECMNFLASLNILDEDSMWKAGRDNQIRLLGIEDREIQTKDPVSVIYKDNSFSIVNGE